MKIPLNKGDICPICIKKIVKPNTWVRFHIKYKPEMQILACKYCNYTEFCLRTGIKGSKALSKIRVNRVLFYLKKFDIEI